MTTSSRTEGAPADDSSAITRQQWKWSALAGMASYLDAGSIVALGAGMALLQTHFGLSDGMLGALAAIGPNAIGCALTWRVRVPANTSARVHIPAQPGANVTEGGGPLEAAAGIRITGRDDRALVCDVGAGHFTFVSTI